MIGFFCQTAGVRLFLPLLHGRTKLQLYTLRLFWADIQSLLLKISQIKWSCSLTKFAVFGQYCKWFTKLPLKFSFVLVMKNKQFLFPEQCLVFIKSYI